MGGAISEPSAEAPGMMPTPTPAGDPVPAPAAGVVDDVVSAPASGGRKKALIFGGLFGLLALGAFVFVSGKAKKKPSMPVPEAPPMPMPTAAAPVLPPPTPPPAIDPREAAIDAAKEWELPDGRRLGQALETLSPPIGNLSPWMAEPLTGDRLSVNYFAHGGGSGAPTVAYQFEVALGAKTVAGRNPAAKAVIAGKAAPPPAPPKAKQVKIVPKAKKAKAAPAKPKEENLDSLLGTTSGDAPKAGPISGALGVGGAEADNAAPAEVSRALRRRGPAGGGPTGEAGEADGRQARGQGLG